jgi:two-component system, OmpR family, sensor histidine kinase BaeS
MRIQSKLFLGIALGSAVLVAVMYGLMQWSVDRGMLRYVNQREAQQLESVVARFARYYSEHQRWDALRSRRSFDLIASGGVASSRPHPPGAENGPGRRRPPPGSGRGPDRPPPGPGGLALLDADKNLIKGRLEDAADRALLPIIVDEQTVGWLAWGARDKISDGFELQFLEGQREALLAISVLVFIVSAALSLLLARHFVRPIKQLAQGAGALASGDYGTRLVASRPDELGQLARDFNELAQALDANRENRQRWFADISHELRTPLAILRGEIDALLDGVRPLELELIKSLAEEVKQLERLVEDLYELSNADIGALKYRKEPLSLSALLDSVLNQHGPAIEQKKLRLSRHYDTRHSYEFWGDPVRLRQLLDNLVINCVKYTDAGGQLQLGLQRENNEFVVTLEDSPPGVSERQLAQLFDHLYRAESSRNRATGGSGLGLSICRQIVEAHQGEIEALHSELGGIKIRISLPC